MTDDNGKILLDGAREAINHGRAMWEARLANSNSDSVDIEDGLQFMFLVGVRWAETQAMRVLDQAGAVALGTVRPGDSYCLKCAVFGHASGSIACKVYSSLGTDG